MKYTKNLFSRSKDLTNYFAASLVSMIVSLVLNPFVAINMTKDDFAVTGYYASFNLLLLPIVSFSFLQFYNKSYYKFNDNARQNLLNTIISSQLLFGGLLLIIACIGYYFYHQQCHITIPYFPYTILFFTSVYFSQFFSNYQTKLKFEKNSKSFLRNAILQTCIHGACIVLFVVTIKLKAFGYALAAIIPSIIMAIYSLRKTLTNFYIDKQLLKEAFFFCWPLILANMMEYIYSGIDRSFLVTLHNNEQLGLYNIAVSIGSYVTVFYTTISQTFQPDLFEAVAKKDKHSVFRLVTKIQILNIIPIVLFIVFAPFIIKVLTFGRYVDATPFARIIALKGIFAALYFSLSSIIVASGLSKITLLNKAIGTILVYFLFSLLISRYAYLGAAWGQALSYVVMIIISFVFIMLNKKQIFL